MFNPGYTTVPTFLMINLSYIPVKERVRTFGDEGVSRSWLCGSARANFEDLITSLMESIRFALFVMNS